MSERIQQRVAGVLSALFVTTIIVTLGVVGFAPTPAEATLRAVAGGNGGTPPGGGTAVGTTSGLTSGRVTLSVTPSTVTDDANLTYSSAGPIVTVGSGTTTSAGVQVGYSGTSSNGWLGATSLTPSNANATLLITASGNTVVGANAAQILIRPTNSNSSTAGVVFSSTGFIRPEQDGVLAFGQTASRFSSAFLGSGTAITTSAPAEDASSILNQGATKFVQHNWAMTCTACAATTVFVNATSAGSTVWAVGINGDVQEANTIAGATGPQTINKPGGRVLLAGAGASVVVTNSLVTANTRCFANISSGTDVTAKSVQCNVTSNTLTLVPNSAPTGQIGIDWQIFN